MLFVLKCLKTAPSNLLHAVGASMLQNRFFFKKLFLTVGVLISVPKKSCQERLRLRTWFFKTSILTWRSFHLSSNRYPIVTQHWTSVKSSRSQCGTAAHVVRWAGPPNSKPQGPTRARCGGRAETKTNSGGLVMLQPMVDRRRCDWLHNAHK